MLGSHGNLGNGLHYEGGQTTPKLIPNLGNIAMCAAGYQHSLALDKTGKVFSWGSGKLYVYILMQVFSTMHMCT